jgi:hypothetical protein
MQDDSAERKSVCFVDISVMPLLDKRPEKYVARYRATFRVGLEYSVPKNHWTLEPALTKQLLHSS